MSNLAEDLLSRFVAIRENKGEQIDMGDAAMVISNLMDIIEEYNTKTEKNIYGEIKDISQKIKMVKDEIVDNLPNGVVPEATQELDAVVRSTEDATNRILDSADKIKASANKSGNAPIAEEIEGEVIKIFEACNFQDITGQRIKKVTSALQYIEGAIENILVNFENDVNKNNPKPKKKLSDMKIDSLASGPQLEEVAPSQEDIDRLFDSV